MQSIADEYLSKIKVKVTRAENDGRKNLCGEPFNEEEQCWYIPAHQADYAKATYTKYTVHPHETNTSFHGKKADGKIDHSAVKHINEPPAISHEPSAPRKVEDIHSGEKSIPHENIKRK